MATTTQLNPYLNGSQALGDQKLDNANTVIVREDILRHPTHADGFVDRNDPVMIGTPAASGIPGIALFDAAATTDFLAVAVTGARSVWIFNVEGEDGAGNVAVNYGDVVFQDTDGVVNKDSTNGTRFGVYLGSGVLSGATTPGPVLLV